MAVHAMRSARASALALASVMARDTQDADAEGCTVIWSNLIYLALNNLLMVYRDITNGVGMAGDFVRSATALALALASAMARHCLNADAKGCTVI